MEQNVKYVSKYGWLKWNWANNPVPVGQPDNVIVRNVVIQMLTLTCAGIGVDVHVYHVAGNGMVPGIIAVCKIRIFLKLIWGQMIQRMKHGNLPDWGNKHSHSWSLTSIVGALSSNNSSSSARRQMWLYSKTTNITIDRVIVYFHQPMGCRQTACQKLDCPDIVDTNLHFDFHWSCCGSVGCRCTTFKVSKIVTRYKKINGGNLLSLEPHQGKKMLCPKKLYGKVNRVCLSNNCASLLFFLHLVVHQLIGKNVPGRWEMKMNKWAWISQNWLGT